MPMRPLAAAVLSAGSALALAAAAIAGDWKGQDLSRKDLRSQRMEGADLTDANLDHAEMSGMNLKKAIFRNASLEGTRLVGCDLTEADFRDSRFGPFIQGSDLSGANFEGLDLRGASFQNSKLVGANLRNAKNIADLTNADLRDADLRGADIPLAKDYTGNSIQLKGARYDGKSRLPEHIDPESRGMIRVEAGQQAPPPAKDDGTAGKGPNFQGKDLSRRDLRRMNLLDANLRESKLMFSDMTGMKLGAADLRHADLEGTRLAEADLTGADLRECNFGAFAQRVNFSKTNMEGLDFRGNSVYQSKFRGANVRASFNWKDIRECDFREADVRGADFTGATGLCSGVNFKGAIHDKFTRWPADLDVESSGSVLKDPPPPPPPPPTAVPAPVPAPAPDATPPGTPAGGAGGGPAKPKDSVPPQDRPPEDRQPRPDELPRTPDR